MSLSAIFDPVVRAYFENKYANSGGGGGGAEGGTGICASTTDTLVLELKPSVIRGLETVEIDGYPCYKLSENCEYAAGTPGDTLIALLESTEDGPMLGVSSVDSSGSNWTNYLGYGAGGFVYNFSHRDGYLFMQCVNRYSGNGYNIHAIDATSGKSPGVYIEDDYWIDGYTDRMILTKPTLE